MENFMIQKQLNVLAFISILMETLFITSVKRSIEPKRALISYTADTMQKTRVLMTLFRVWMYLSYYFLGKMQCYGLRFASVLKNTLTLLADQQKYLNFKN